MLKASNVRNVLGGGSEQPSPLALRAGGSSGRGSVGGSPGPGLWFFCYGSRAAPLRAAGVICVLVLIFRCVAYASGTENTPKLAETYLSMQLEAPALC